MVGGLAKTPALHDNRSRLTSVTFSEPPTRRLIHLITPAS
jgi:hypothetical protein